MKQTVYKVVQRTGDNTFSSTTFKNPYKVEYVIGKRAAAEVGKLFVFKDLGLAEDFCRANSRSYILKCETESKLIKGKFRASYVMSCRLIEKFWGDASQVDLDYIDAVPKGTYLVDNLTPIEIIYANSL